MFLDQGFSGKLAFVIRLGLLALDLLWTATRLLLGQTAELLTSLQ